MVSPIADGLKAFHSGTRCVTISTYGDADGSRRDPGLLERYSDWSDGSDVSVSLGSPRRVSGRLAEPDRTGAPVLLALERLQTVFDFSPEVTDAPGSFPRRKESMYRDLENPL